jgi:hypothetical protein
MHVPKEKIALPIILAAVAIFYLAQLVQPYAFRSPDEAANHVFITRFSNAQQLAFASPLTETEQQFYQPRSVVTTDGQIRPGSFLGFIMLHGSLTKWFGSLMHLTSWQVMPRTMVSRICSSFLSAISRRTPPGISCCSTCYSTGIPCERSIENEGQKYG